jgi:hypothetical protein
MQRLATAALALVSLALPAHAQLKAKFIDGTYVFTVDGCAKLKALAAGGNQSISTVPWYVTADGISYWEGGCGFTKIKPGKKKNEWKVTASCGEEDGESTESYTYLKTSPTTFSVTLTTPGASADDQKPVTYTRCDVGPIPDPQ